MTVRVDREPAFLLHVRPYRESSSLVEALTPNHGRVGLVHRAGRKRGAPRPSLFTFQNISWSGSGELGYLRELEDRGTRQLEPPELKVCGLYVNELVLKLVPRHTTGNDFFVEYQTLLAKMDSNDNLEIVLRRFELVLLEAIGYGLQLEADAETGEPINATVHYIYDYERGPLCARTDADRTTSGRTLLGLRDGCLEDQRSLREAKRLLRGAIDFHLQGRRLLSRELMQLIAGSRA